jgi:hypothetical protein
LGVNYTTIIGQGACSLKCNGNWITVKINVVIMDSTTDAIKIYDF